MTPEFKEFYEGLDESGKAWFHSRPQTVKDIMMKCPYNHVYKIKETGQHCVLFSAYEDGTFKVIAWRPDCLDLAHIFTRAVFGIKPDDLEMIPGFDVWVPRYVIAFQEAMAKGRDETP